MIGDAAQFQELVTLYSSYGDEELVQLGQGMADLTEMAQEALKGELLRRGLKGAPTEKPAAARVLSEDDLSDMRAYAASAPAECIFDFEDERTVTAAYYALTGEGIEAIVVSGGVVSGGAVSGGARPDRRGPRVVVTPKDAERAAAILSRPSAEELKAETEETFEGFNLPQCPACGGEETLLESVDPVNQWRCDHCGHTWLEESVSSVD
jgi:rubrerythrin